MATTTSQASNGEIIPFWNVNVPRDKWTTECPEFLEKLGELEERHVGTPDKDYRVMSWETVQQILNANQLEALKRVPSDLRRYRAFIHNIKQSHGSVFNFILKERLKWKDINPRGAPFQDPGIYRCRDLSDFYSLADGIAEDVKILYNDWPYGIDSKIIHLVVWTKFHLEVDPNDAAGDITPKARNEIQNYVNATFHQDENPNHVGWFKNWAALKSVHAVEHFHVMLHDPDPEFVRRITNGDIALSSLSDKELSI